MILKFPAARTIARVGPLLFCLILAQATDLNGAALNSSTSASSFWTLDDSDQVAQGLRYYKAGEYEAAANKFEQYLTANSSDLKVRFVLAGTLVKAGQTRRAEEQLKIFERSGLPEAQIYTQKLRALLSNTNDTLGRAQISSLLRQYRVKEARLAVEHLAASPADRELILFRIDLAEGKLVSALGRILKLQQTNPEFSTQASDMHAEVKRISEGYQETLTLLARYRDSELATGNCSPQWIKQASANADFSLREYGRLVNKLVDLEPMNPISLDLLFHLSLLAGDYGRLEEIGNKAFAAKGSVKVPFYSSDALFHVVIDSRGQKIFSTEETTYSHGERAYKNMRAAVPFSLQFSDLRSFSQRVRSDPVTHALSKDSYAVMLNDQGNAPYYNMMGFLHCAHGELAQRRATHNLGRFIVAATNQPAIAAKLVDPTSTSRDWLDVSGRTVSTGSTVTMAIVESAQGPTTEAKIGGLLKATDELLSATGLASHSPILQWSQRATELTDSVHMYGFDHHVFDLMKSYVPTISPEATRQ